MNIAETKINSYNWVYIKRTLTFSFSSFVISLADEFSILHQIKFISGIQLSTADDATETLQMVYEILRSANYLCWRNTKIDRFMIITIIANAVLCWRIIKKPRCFDRLVDEFCNKTAVTFFRISSLLVALYDKQINN